MFNQEITMLAENIYVLEKLKLVNLNAAFADKLETLPGDATPVGGPSWARTRDLSLIRTAL